MQNGKAAYPGKGKGKGNGKGKGKGYGNGYALWPGYARPWSPPKDPGMTMLAKQMTELTKAVTKTLKRPENEAKQEAKAAKPASSSEVSGSTGPWTCKECNLSHDNHKKIKCRGCAAPRKAPAQPTQRVNPLLKEANVKWCSARRLDFTHLAEEVEEDEEASLAAMVDGAEDEPLAAQLSVKDEANAKERVYLEDQIKAAEARDEPDAQHLEYLKGRLAKVPALSPLTAVQDLRRLTSMLCDTQKYYMDMEKELKEKAEAKEKIIAEAQAALKVITKEQTDLETAKLIQLQNLQKSIDRNRITVEGNPAGSIPKGEPKAAPADAPKDPFEHLEKFFMEAMAEDGPQLMKTFGAMRDRLEAAAAVHAASLTAATASAAAGTQPEAASGDGARGGPPAEKPAAAGARNRSRSRNKADDEAEKTGEADK
jgi:hypothetical protein